MKLVAIVCDGELKIHIPGCINDYATICGLDGDDPTPGVQQSTVAVPRGAKVDCEHCAMIWERCREYRKSAFKSDS